MKHDFIWDRTSMLSTCFRCGAVAQSREHAETALCVGFSPPPERIQVGRYVYIRSDLVILKDERVSALLDVATAFRGLCADVRSRYGMRPNEKFRCPIMQRGEEALAAYDGAGK